MTGYDPYNHTGRFVPQPLSAARKARADEVLREWWDQTWLPRAEAQRDPIACTLREGGEWIPFPVWQEKDTEAAAVMYGDGRIFDVKLAEWRETGKDRRWVVEI